MFNVGDGVGYTRTGRGVGDFVGYAMGTVFVGSTLVGVLLRIFAGFVVREFLRLLVDGFRVGGGFL